MPKEKPRLEKEIQRAILEYLRLTKPFLTIWRNNNMSWKTKKGNWVKTPYSLEGIPDILGFDIYGRFIGIEVKRTEKSPKSDAQIKFIERALKNNAVAFFTWSIDDCNQKLDKFYADQR